MINQSVQVHIQVRALRAAFQSARLSPPHLLAHHQKSRVQSSPNHFTNETPPSAPSPPQNPRPAMPLMRDIPHQKRAIKLHRPRRKIILAHKPS
jgi:hypothetical protein